MDEMHIVKKVVIGLMVLGYIALFIAAPISLGKTGTEDIYPNCSGPLKEIVQIDIQFGSSVPIVYGFIVYYILEKTSDRTADLTKYIEKCSLNTFGIVLIVVGAISIHIYDEAKHKPDCFDELKSTPGGLQSSIANQNLLLLAQVALAYGIWNILVGSVGVIMIVYDTIKYFWYDDSKKFNRERRYSLMKEDEHSKDDLQNNHNKDTLINYSTDKKDPADPAKLKLKGREIAAK